jgi:membrane protease YdiL (CAAX protease family)
VITTGAMGVVLGTAFLANRRNLMVCVLAHGLYNMVGLTLIYLGKADALRWPVGG